MTFQRAIELLPVYVLFLIISVGVFYKFFLPILKKMEIKIWGIKHKENKQDTTVVVQKELTALEILKELEDQYDRSISEINFHCKRIISELEAIYAAGYHFKEIQFTYNYSYFCKQVVFYRLNQDDYKLRIVYNDNYEIEIDIRLNVTIKNIDKTEVKHIENILKDLNSKDLAHATYNKLGVQY